MGLTETSFPTVARLPKAETVQGRFGIGAFFLFYRNGRVMRMIDFRHSKWFGLLLYAQLLLVVYLLISKSPLSWLGTGGSLAFGAAVLAAKFQRRAVVKYVFAAVSFLLLYVLVAVVPLPFDSVRTVVFYVLTLYAMLLRDWSIVAVGGLLAAIVYSYNFVSPQPEVEGHAVGLVVAALMFALIASLLRRIQEERNKYRELSEIDSLTKSASLARVMAWGEAKRKSGKPIIVMVLDLNSFKQINDTFGHLAGNTVLIRVAECLAKEVARYDGIVGRLGGDEFVAIVEHTAHAEQLPATLTAMLGGKAFAADEELRDIPIVCSVGAAHSARNNGTDSIEQLLHAADVDMYVNKYESRRLDDRFEQVSPLLNDRARHLLAVLAEKDMYTYVHSEYVARYAVLLARAMHLPERTVQEIEAAAWLHDIGKITVSSHVLRKPAKLTEREYSLIRLHVLDGMRLLESLDLSETMRNAILYHHERWDGGGYPHQIKGEDTPMEGGIMQIADAFSAMTIKRVYRERATLAQALKELDAGSGKQFHPALVKVFIDAVKRRDLSLG
jgi:diguanylate cyclase (GGDEF)-like protein/putative nucleotidyltransferase with HDIG domain